MKKQNIFYQLPLFKTLIGIDGGKGAIYKVLYSGDKTI